MNNKSHLKKLRKNIVWPHNAALSYYGVKAPILTNCSGSTYTDIDGVQYIDALAGVANVNLGYGQTKIIDAMKKQLDQLSYNYSSYSISVPELELAESLLNILPKNMGRIFFGTGGSEANETAIKLARQYHCISGNEKKHRIISRKISYHGGTLGALSATSFLDRTKVFKPLLLDFPKVNAAYPYRSNIDELDLGVQLAQELEQTIKNEVADTISAFIVEPVVGMAGGAIVPPSNYMKNIRKICDKYNILLIFDEIITGFGRTGKMFAAEHWNVAPDIMTMGKGLTSGYSPLSAVSTSKKINKIFEDSDSTFMHGITYGGHPVSCAAGQASLNMYVKKNMSDHANSKGDILINAFKNFKHNIIGDVRGLGLLIGIELVSDQGTKKPFKLNQEVGKFIASKSLEKGVKVYGGKGAEPELMGDLIIISPPFVIESMQINKIIEVIDEAISSAEKEFL